MDIHEPDRKYQDCGTKTDQIGGPARWGMYRAVAYLDGDNTTSCAYRITDRPDSTIQLELGEIRRPAGKRVSTTAMSVDFSAEMAADFVADLLDSLGTLPAEHPARVKLAQRGYFDGGDLAALKAVMVAVDTAGLKPTCICHVMKPGYTCPYCQARAAIAKAQPTTEGL